MGCLARLLANHPDDAKRDPERAIALARKSVDQSPRDADLWNTLGVAYYRAGKWDDAIAALNKSMELRAGGDAYDWFFLAMTHKKAGRADEARKWFEQAAHWAPDPRSRFLLAGMKIDAIGFIVTPVVVGNSLRQDKATRVPPQSQLRAWACLADLEQHRANVVDAGKTFSKRKETSFPEGKGALPFGNV